VFTYSPPFDFKITPFPFVTLSLEGKGEVKKKRGFTPLKCPWYNRESVFLRGGYSPLGVGQLFPERQTMIRGRLGWEKIF